MTHRFLTLSAAVIGVLTIAPLGTWAGDDEVPIPPPFEAGMFTSDGVKRLLDNANRCFPAVKEHLAKAKAEFSEIDIADEKETVNRIEKHVEMVHRRCEDARKAAQAAENVAGKLDQAGEDDYAQQAHAAAKKLLKLIEERDAFYKMRLEYASAIVQARSHLAYALGRRPEPSDERGYLDQFWPSCLRFLDKTAEQVEAARKISPSRHPEADAISAKVAETRKDAETKLTDLCVRMARECAKKGDQVEAGRYARALAEALPNRPEGKALVAEVAGKGESTAKAAAELKERTELLGKRLSEAAEAYRPVFLEWAKKKEHRTDLKAALVLANPDAQRGQRICLPLGVFAPADFTTWTSKCGDERYVGASPELGTQWRKRDQVVHDYELKLRAAVANKHGVKEDVLPYPEGFAHLDVTFFAEVDGLADYQTYKDVKDSSGRIIGEVEGEVIKVPRLKIIAGLGKWYGSIPGVSESTDKADLKGIMPE